MKRSLVCLVLFLLVASHVFGGERRMIPRYNKLTKTWISYPFYTIHDLQFVPQDSLLKADTLGMNNVYWTLQASRLALPGVAAGPDSEVVTLGLVVCPQNIITYTAMGHTLLLHDTVNNYANEWGGMLVRWPGDSTTFPTWVDLGYPSVQKGDLVYLTGKISEYDVAKMNSTTQFAPDMNIAPEVVAHNIPIPAPTLLNITDLNHGPYNSTGPFSKPYSIAEQYECSLVELTGLTVTNYLNSGRQLVLNGAGGNQLTDYDWSFYFTIGNAGGPGDPNFHQPPVLSTMDTIRGTIGCTSGGEISDGYRIIPLYPGDIVWGLTLPLVNTHRRYPVIVTPNDSVQVQVSTLKGTLPVYKTVIVKSINFGPWTVDTLGLLHTTSVPDSNVYAEYILDSDGNPWPAGTSVRYFFKAIDNFGDEGVYANPSGALGRDTTKGFFFYSVVSNGLTIHDVQYTPYINGRSPYVGGVTSVPGIVTADTTVMRLAPLSSTPTGVGTNAYYIQDGSGPWNGIWVISTDSLSAVQLSAVRLGDSVVVYGAVEENFEVTTFFDSTVNIVAHHRPLPAPVTITSGTLRGGNGDPAAEQWEGCLVRVVNARVVDTSAYWTNITEYGVSDGTGEMNVLRDGVNNYSNHAADTTNGDRIFHIGDRVDTMIGIVYFSYGQYKLVPRSNADIVAGEPYPYQKDWNLVSVGRNQQPAVDGYTQSALFPGSMGTPFAYQGRYVPVLSGFNPDVGYWLKFPAATTIRQLGVKRTHDYVPVNAGWNIIGTIADTVAVSSVTPQTPGNTLSHFFEYSTGYAMPGFLKPAKGYWVKSAMRDSLLIASTPMAKSAPFSVDINQFNTLTITDKSGSTQTLLFGQDAEGKLPLASFELPPPGPASKMDVRFSTGRILEAHPATIVSPLNYPIVINGAQAPLKLKWNIISPNGKQYTLSDEANGKIFKPTVMTGAGEITLNKAAVGLMLSAGPGAALPKEFSLGQNYPNPFNPTTSFVIGLPQTAHLQILVYNILGQKVATLVDEERSAGFQTITWNGTSQSGVSVASGVYFVRMMAEPSNGVGRPFVGLRKVLMMK